MNISQYVRYPEYRAVLSVPPRRSDDSRGKAISLASGAPIKFQERHEACVVSIVNNIRDHNFTQEVPSGVVRPISVRSPFCFPRDGDLPLLQRGKRSQPEKGKARRARRVSGQRHRLFSREKEHLGERGSVSLFGSPFPECQWVTCIDKDAATIPRRVCRDKRRRLRRRERGSFEEKSYYRYYSNSVRVDMLLCEGRERERERARARALGELDLSEITVRQRRVSENSQLLRARSLIVSSQVPR